LIRYNRLLSRWDQVKVWWHGVPTTITPIEGERFGYRLQYQHPDYPPARVRLMAALRTPIGRIIASAIGAIILAVIIAAITRWLGLT
jgi:hypothetical protein